MASGSASPKVVGVVDEANNEVSIGVELGGKFLPVASASLAYAQARDLDAPGKSKAGAQDEGGEG